MTTYAFADVALRRQATLARIARQGRLAAPLTGLLRGVFAVSRALGLEYPLFRRFFKPMAGMFDTAIAKAFAGYTPTARDVFVCSYFKSGTNWAMHMAYQVAERGEGEFEDILDVIPWVDCPNQDTTVARDDPRPARRSKTGRRIIKTHARARFVPYNEQARYICLVRDPKDVVVSGHHFFGSMLPAPARTASGEIPLGPAAAVAVGLDHHRPGVAVATTHLVPIYGTFGDIAHRAIHGARVSGEPGKVLIRHDGEVHMHDGQVRRHAPVGTVHDDDLVVLRAPRSGDIAQVIAGPVEVLVAMHQDCDARHGTRRLFETRFSPNG